MLSLSELFPSAVLSILKLIIWIFVFSVVPVQNSQGYAQEHQQHSQHATVRS